MRRSLQEVVELVVFGLVALLIGTGLLWLVGWVFSLGGLLLKAVAGLLWLLLRFVVPVAIVAGLVYFIVKALQGREAASATAAPAGAASHTASPSAPPAPAVAPAPAAPAAPATAAGAGASGHTESPAASTSDPETTEPGTESAPGEEPSEDDA